MNRRRFFALFPALVLPYERAIAKPTPIVGSFGPELNTTYGAARLTGTTIWRSDATNEENLRLLKVFYETHKAPYTGWRFKDGEG